MSSLTNPLYVVEVEKTLSQLTIKRKGSVKASRNNPKGYSKQKEIQSCRKMSFLGKTLSSETAYASLSISENPINLLKIGTSGDISRSGLNNSLLEALKHLS